jgi:Domain of unknown function (DUF1963)
MNTKPPRTLLPQLELLLSTRPAGVVEAIRRVVTDVRPCVVLASTRTMDVPLRGRLIDRLLRRAPPQPRLPKMASKFGGIPYAENLSELLGGVFIGQVNFAEVTHALTSQGCSLPQGMPARGLLAVDLVRGLFEGRARWYPDPDESRSVLSSKVRAAANYEASIDFKGGWSLRGLDWFDSVPKGDDELWEYMNDLEIPGVDVDGRYGHKLFGHPNEVLNDTYNFRSAPGRSNSMRDHALLWRIDFDHAAGFSWGTNWIYVLIHKDDLARGALQHAVVTVANA